MAVHEKRNEDVFFVGSDGNETELGKGHSQNEPEEGKRPSEAFQADANNAAVIVEQEYVL